MGNQAIGQDLFLRLLARRLGGKYDIKTLQSVLSAYTSEQFGIRALLRSYEEFRDDYFGYFRLTVRGLYNFGQYASESWKCNMKNSSISHEWQVYKKAAEKRNNHVWMARNLIEGHKFRDKQIQAFLHIKCQTKGSQIAFMARKNRKQLQIERKTRRV